MALDPTVLQGILNTASGDTTIQVRDVADTVLELQPNATPLTKLMSKLAKKEAYNLKFEEYEHEPIPQVFTIAAAVADGSTVSVTFDHPEYLVAGVTLYVPGTDEYMVVQTAPTSGATTVVRGANAAAIANGSLCYILGIAREQGGFIGTSRKVQEVSGYNYIQHFERTISMSIEDANTKVYGALTNRQAERARQGLEILKDIELTLFLGKRSSQTIAGNLVTTCGGLGEWISTNVHDLKGVSLDEDVFDSGLIVDLEYGSDDKWFFCSSIISQRINSWAKNRIRHNSELSGQYGFTVVDYIVNGKIVHLVTHPLFKGKTIADPTGLGGMGFTIDMAPLSYRVHNNTGTMKGGDLKFYPDLQPANANYIQDSWEAWIGMERRHERMFGFWKNIGA